ncbi:hypothetical protein LG296_03850 [Ureibacillus chungkukjangi]|uniref:hypothetical protein n=1 Tax=Ureibacillus chungkukjangi TaxID=1202712 RepID=UPI00384D7107
MLYLNDNTESTYKEIIYQYICFIADELEVKYNKNHLRNPYKEKNARTSANTEIYSINEYLELVSYVSDVDYHKKRCYKEFKRPLNNTEKYKSYESVWLYIILHLNNDWRSHDVVTKVPRITLPESITDFDDFLSRKLTIEEKDKIIAEITSKYFTIKSSKKDKDGHFFCSEELQYPLANALIACTLNQNHKNNPYLIEFNSSNELPNSLNKRFFQEFSNTQFLFKSKKMNTTLSTFTYEYIKHCTNLDPMQITKMLRPHSSFNTTKKYIKLSQFELDRLSRNLFDDGNFGYTYDYLHRIVFGNSLSEDKIILQERKRYLKTLFGDSTKLENLSTQLISIERDFNSLTEYLSSLDNTELQKKLMLINLRQLPAKNEHWQCLLGDCLFLDRDCEKCPFSIPHFYTLVNVISNLEKIVNDMKVNFLTSLETEKRFKANILYRYLFLLSTAKKKFGASFLNEFSNGRYDVILERVRNLPNIKKYITLQEV